MSLDNVIAVRGRGGRSIDAAVLGLRDLDSAGGLRRDAARSS
jgi:hypothetical protein